MLFSKSWRCEVLGLAIGVSCLLILGTEAAYRVPPLPYEYNALEPVVNNQTNHFHHDVHHAGYVTRTNKAVANRTDLNALPLHQLLARVGDNSLPAEIQNEVRNQGGGAWNHDLWWFTLAPPGSKDTEPSSVSSTLSSAISSSSYKDLAGLTSQLKTAGSSRFGSGWSWLIVKPDKGLDVTSTSNQDNPLMKLPNATYGVPILGIDVWEHSYYLMNGPNRTAYLDNIFKIVNWTRVSENYDYAVQGKLSSILGEEYDLPEKSS